MFTESTSSDQDGPTPPSSTSSSHPHLEHHDHPAAEETDEDEESNGSSNSSAHESDSDIDIDQDGLDYDGEDGIPLRHVHTTTTAVTTATTTPTFIVKNVIDDDSDESSNAESLLSSLDDGDRQRHNHTAREALQVIDRIDGRFIDTQAPARRTRRYARDEEDSVLRKFDRKLVFFLAALYLVSFLDRSNIGNARIAGMDEDLQTDPPNKGWYEWALTAFYLSYILFEWMSILWRIIPAHIYVFGIVMTWGVSASLQSITTSYPQLIFLRAVLGVGEAAFTGVPFYLSFFFRREELAYRTAMFISAAPLATSVASTVAWLVLRVAGGQGNSGVITPWRLLFLIEGLPSVVMAVVAWHKIPDTPETASFLTPREKQIAKWRVKDEKKLVAPQALSPPGDVETKTKRKQTRASMGMAALKDPSPWLTSVMLFLANMAYSSLPVFLPTVLTDMGYSPLQAQGMAAPPYLASFLSVLAVSSLSDASRSRSPYIILSALASSLGYFVLAISEQLDFGYSVRYAAVYPAAIGFFNVVTLTIAWNINNGRGAAERGVGFVILQLVGQCGPLIGTRLYPKDDAPYYTRGMAVCCFAMAGVAGLAWGLRAWFLHLNRNLDAEEGTGDTEEVRGLVARAEEEEAEGGRGGGDGRRGRFRFML